MITAIVLAAGTSSRLGRTKQLLELDGRPLLAHAVALAAKHFDEVVVILGYQADRIEAALELPSNARIVRNDAYLEGQRSSVRRGLAAASEGGNDAAVLLGDQPRVPDELIERTIETFRHGRADVVRPRHGDAPGHPVIVRSGLARRLGAGEDDAVACPLRGSEVGWITAHPEAPADVDTWEAYEALLGRPGG